MNADGGMVPEHDDYLLEEFNEDDLEDEERYISYLLSGNVKAATSHVQADSHIGSSLLKPKGVSRPSSSSSTSSSINARPSTRVKANTYPDPRVFNKLANYNNAKDDDDDDEGNQIMSRIREKQRRRSSTRTNATSPTFHATNPLKHVRSKISHQIKADRSLWTRVNKDTDDLALQAIAKRRLGIFIHHHHHHHHHRQA